MTSSAQPVRVTVDEGRVVSGLLLVPPDARVCYVLAHGAGAGMAHPFLSAIANGLAERGVATLRYQFPYMEQGSKRPDRSWRTLPSARPCWRHHVWFPILLFSRVANPLAAV